MNGRVVAVASSSTHRFSKDLQPVITLEAGLGVVGDAHAGATVKHRSRVAVDPTQPNLRQVHLIHAELFTELAAKGFAISPAVLGENVTTTGIDLLGLSRGTRLIFDSGAVVEVTGLRNPCHQIEDFRPRLLAAVLDKTADGKLIRKSGIMSVVITSGDIRAGDGITVVPPDGPFIALDRV